jgi:peptide/nickel transport system ATP-binding protein
VQAQTLNLMSDLEREAGVTFLLISHDLAVVAHICETTAVMYRGRIVEIGETAAMFAQPAHPYTRELVDATPRLDQPMRAPLAPASGGAETGEGCPYAARCAFARARCREETPMLERKGDGSRKVACHYPLG